MLKIKDNVDLEKLAIIYNLDRDFGGLYYVYVPLFNRNIKKGTILRIDIKTRELQLLVNPPYWELNLTYSMKNPLLKKLIKADLVECVEDE